MANDYYKNFVACSQAKDILAEALVDARKQIVAKHRKACLCKKGAGSREKCALCRYAVALDKAGYCFSCGRHKEDIGCRFNDGCWECPACGFIQHVCWEMQRPVKDRRK